MAEQIAQAAHWLGADILSPAAESPPSTSLDPVMPEYVPFTTKNMVDAAHALGMIVKPWTVSLAALCRLTSKAHLFLVRLTD